MAITLDKSAIISLMNNKLGLELNDESFTDEELNGFLIQQEEEEEQHEEENEEDTEDSDTTGENSDDAEDTDDPLEAIDRDSLDPSAQLIYDALINQKNKLKKKEIEIEINNSGLHAKHKSILERMAKNGLPITEIQSTIADLKELENSSNRNKGKTNFTSKTKVKTSKTTPANTEPKYGTAEFGKMLAKKKQNIKTGGNK